MLPAIASLVLVGGCAPGNSPAPDGELRSRPLIGISSTHIPNGKYDKVASSYTQAVRDAGGAPLILPVIADKALAALYAGILDGLLLTGGDDVPPEAYGQKPVTQTKTLSPKRHAFEKMMLETWLPTGRPILGVCRGLQQTNVVCGGSLIQNIPTQTAGSVIHRAPGDTVHAIEIEPGTKLAAILAARTIRVNTNHHQAADKVGENLKVAARSPDGLTEALEFTDGRFGLLVQWHPERSTNPNHRKAIFEAFVQACREKRTIKQ